MVRLKSRSASAVGGFIFIDSAISHAPMQDWSFESLCQRVQAQRSANPRFNLTTDINAIRNEVDKSNALRMLGMKGADGFIVNDTAPDPNFPMAHSRSAAQNVVASIKSVGAGVATLTDWLGEGGKPVDQEEANRRASICSECLINGKGDWKAFFTEPAAQALKRKLELKHAMKLETPFDAKLVVCNGCGCQLQLKVWTPLDVILKHTTPDVKTKLDKKCWVIA